MTVIEQVVKRKWCVGCGMCVAVCPKGRLDICWNSHGEYNPITINNAPACGSSCSLCYDVCPAHGDTKNETEIGKELYGLTHGIQHSPETGYWLSSYAGYSKEHRLNSASGGMATWMLERLLITGEVDAVVAVGRTSNPDKLFEYKVCESIEQIRECSRSAYYPVEVSNVIRHMLETKRRYVIVGLPCICKSIRLAQDKFPALKERIKYVLGLTCGHASSKFFAEYICALGGGNPHQLKEFIFRTKDLSQPASNHGMTFRAGDGPEEVSKQVLWRNKVGVAFSKGYFQIPGCFYCDDIHAECADAVFMDAWLPEYSKIPEGNSIFLIRNTQLEALVIDGDRHTALSVEALPIKKVIKSQWGVVERKRRKTYNLLEEPFQRTELMKSVNCLQRCQVAILRMCSAASAENWYVVDKNLACFRRKMIPFHIIIYFLAKLSRLFRGFRACFTKLF